MSENLPLVRVPIVWVSVVLIGASCAAFGTAQYFLNAVNGWWLDELFALWASDTSISFTSIFVERISPDTNPPLYFSALYCARLLIGNERAAVLALNSLFILAAVATILYVSTRARLTGLAAASVAAFLLSGPVTYYAAEGRAYAAALAIAFTASWCVAMALEKPENRPSWPIFAALGTLAALTHVYAALLCGALAASLLILALYSKRWKDLAGVSLALGLSTSIVFGIWFITITGSLGRVDWIQFTLQGVYDAAWHAKKLTLGPRAVFVLVILLLLFGLMRKTTRPLAFVFVVAFSLFISLPLIVSLKKPIITGQYWLIGAPSLIPVLAFLARRWYLETTAASLLSWPALANLGVGIVVCVASISGFAVAYDWKSSKPIWKGAELVRPYLKGCPARSVHVGMGTIRNSESYLTGFSEAARVSSTLFADVSLDSTPLISVDTARCPVMGWAEHVLGDDSLLSATDAELLRVLKIDASPSEVDIRRHYRGFVVLRRGLPYWVPAN